MRHTMLNMTDEISKKPGKCSISRSDAFEGMYKTCGAAIGADTFEPRNAIRVRDSTIYVGLFYIIYLIVYWTYLKLAGIILVAI